MINIFLFLSAVFLLTFLLGRLLEKFRIPWVFSALIVGVFLSAWNPFAFITSSSVFLFLSELGMYFLLFMIGFEVNLKDFRKSGGFIFRATFIIIFLEAMIGSLLVHFVFGYSWIISSIVALSFATVGEVVLIPILDEFKIVNTRLGRNIIGIGILDDMVEILLLVLLGVIVGFSFHSGFNVFLTLGLLVLLFGFTIGLIKLKSQGTEFKFLPIESLFVFVLFVLFLFLGVGELAKFAPIAALFAGVSLNVFIPKGRLEGIRREVKTLCYGFFAPIFFLWVGLTTNIYYLISSPLLILLIVVVSGGTKILASWLIGSREFGTKESLLLGIGISIRFSTSLIITRILFDNGLIGSELYSIIVASSMVFTFVVPVLFSKLLLKWNVVGGGKA